MHSEPLVRGVLVHQRRWETVGLVLVPIAEASAAVALILPAVR
jgi:hypothetical protein